MEFQTPLAKVKGLGTAKAGTGHFWMQRITAIALIPLSFWMVLFTKQFLNSTHTEIILWLASPLNISIAIAWIIAAFYHAALGLQVVVEDYVHTEWRKITLIWLIKLSFFFIALLAIVAIFQIAGME
ncbi:MAG: succinate dehydrogenase, hydrophobic membrane anchor protein [Methylococcales bacterium]|nr:succinate dehydrogenase, hydrophobic membrane anchor protein [Methylococcales bacterium]